MRLSSVGSFCYGFGRLVFINSLASDSSFEPTYFPWTSSARSLILATNPNMDLSQMPSATPPHGVVPNLIDPQNYKHVTITISAIMLPLVVAFFSGRLIHNVHVTRSVGLDDCILGPFWTSRLLATDMQQMFAQLQWYGFSTDESLKTKLELRSFLWPSTPWSCNVGISIDRFSSQAHTSAEMYFFRHQWNVPLAWFTADKAKVIWRIIGVTSVLKF